jgi:hypothetical protein
MTNAELQAKIDQLNSQLPGLQSNLDAIKLDVDNWITGGVAKDCYRADAYTADYWMSRAGQLDPDNCKKRSGCSEHTCRDTYVATINSKLPALRSAYTQVENVKSQIANLTEQLQHSPETQQENVQAEEEGKAKTTKWIFFGLIALAIVAGASFILYKKYPIKKIYTIGGGLTLIIIFYLIFFGVKKPV